MTNSRGRSSVSIATALTLVCGLLFVQTGSEPARAQQMLPCDFGSDGDYSGDYATVSNKGPHKIGEQQIVELDSRLDGVTIQMGLVRPDVPAGMKVPVIVDASPYYHPLQTMDLRACRPFLTENFVPHGYAVALLAVRGTADSGGCMNMMGAGERADLTQAITWLGTRSWSNGSVGMVGKSYDGATQWEVASFGNRHLKTIVPVSGVPDLFELMYGGGRVDWRGPGILNGIYYAESAAFYAPGRDPQHTIEVTACPEYGVGMAASDYSAATGRLDPFGYWAERRYRRDIVRSYRGSVYLVQGLQDWNVNPGQQYPWIRELERRGVYVKHLLGQWGHSWPYDNGSRMDWADVLLNWFNRWLKGDRRAPLGPRVEVEDSRGRWRAASKWPGGEETTLWLNPAHDLSRERSKESSSELITADPLHTQGGYYNEMPPQSLETTCSPGSCAYFETKAFKKEHRIAGLPQLDLSVVPSGPGGGLAAYLYAVTQRAARRIGWGQVNLEFTGRGGHRSVAPGERTDVTVTLQPLDAVVPAGSKLVLVISGGSGWNRLPTLPSYPIQLLVGRNASAVKLHEPQVREDQFFKPPRA